MKMRNVSEQSFGNTDEYGSGSGMNSTHFSQIVPSTVVEVKGNRTKRERQKNNYTDIVNEKSKYQVQDVSNTNSKPNSSCTTNINDVTPAQNLKNMSHTKNLSALNSGNNGKTFSTTPSKYCSSTQKSLGSKGKMKLSELNNYNNTSKFNYTYHSFRQSDLKNVRTNTGTNLYSQRKNKTNLISTIPKNKSSKNFFSKSTGFSNFSKSFGNNHTQKNKKSTALNQSQRPPSIQLSKSSSNLRMNSSKKEAKNSKEKNSYRSSSFGSFFTPRNNQYIGIDLNLVSNSTYRTKENLNSQIQRYLENYNDNCQNITENTNGNEEILGYNFKSGDGYLLPENIGDCIKRNEKDYGLRYDELSKDKKQNCQIKDTFGPEPYNFNIIKNNNTDNDSDNDNDNVNINDNKEEGNERLLKLGNNERDGTDSKNYNNFNLVCSQQTFGKKNLIQSQSPMGLSEKKNTNSSKSRELEYEKNNFDNEQKEQEREQITIFQNDIKKNDDNTMSINEDETKKMDVSSSYKNTSRILYGENSIKPRIEQEEISVINKKEDLSQFVSKPLSFNERDKQQKFNNHKKEDLNNSHSITGPISHVENTSMNPVNQSTPMTSIRMSPYEVLDTPTNYIKSISNTNNLTHNHGKYITSKNHTSRAGLSKEQSDAQSYQSISKSRDEEDQLKSYSHFGLNQSGMTSYINSSNNKGRYNNSNIVQEKEEEKRLTEKLERNHRLKKNEKNNNQNDLEDNYLTNNYGNQYTIEEKDEESDAEIQRQKECLVNIKGELDEPNDKNMAFISKTSEIMQSSQDSLHESELISETKKILEKANDKIKSVNQKNNYKNNLRTKKISKEKELISRKIDKKQEKENEEEENTIIERKQQNLDKFSTVKKNQRKIDDLREEEKIEDMEREININEGCVEEKYVEVDNDTIEKIRKDEEENEKIRRKQEEDERLELLKKIKKEEEEKEKERLERLEIDKKEQEKRIEKLKKEIEEKRRVELEELTLRKKLEEERYRKKFEEERLKKLRIEEEEKNKRDLEEEKLEQLRKKEEEQKRKEIALIKKELEKEEKQRLKIEKEALKLENKIRNKFNINNNKSKNIHESIPSQSGHASGNNSSRKETGATNITNIPSTNNNIKKQNKNYVLLPTYDDNLDVIADGQEEKSISKKEKAEAKYNKDKYIQTSIIESNYNINNVSNQKNRKYNKQYITGGLDNYNSKHNLENEKENKENNICENKQFLKADGFKNVCKININSIKGENYLNNKTEINQHNNKINNSIISNNSNTNNNKNKDYCVSQNSHISNSKSKNKNKNRNKNINEFNRSNSLSAFQIEIVPTQEEKGRRFIYNNSFSSFNFNINTSKANKAILPYKNTPIKSPNLNENENENTLSLNLISGENQNNNNYNTYNNKNIHSNVFKKFKEKALKMMQDDSTQYQNNLPKKINDNIQSSIINDIDPINDLYFRKQKMNLNKCASLDSQEDCYKSSSNFYEMSNKTQNNKNNNNIISNNSISNKNKNFTQTLGNLCNNYPFENDKNKYNSISVRNQPESNYLQFKMNNKMKFNKLISGEDDDDFFKRKTKEVSDDSRTFYEKIPHHLRNGDNKVGWLWSNNRNINDANRNSLTIGMSDKSYSSFSNYKESSNYSNISSIQKSKGFNRKINSSVLPANPFDTVNEAREYFFFND